MKKAVFKSSILLLTIILYSCSSEKEIPKSLPKLTTTTVTDITLVSASSGGIITNDGGSEIYTKGIVWNTAPSPTTSLTTKSIDGSGIGSFSSSVTKLVPSSNYFVRAYAINSVGTGYGNEIIFTTNTATPVVLPSLLTTAVTSITTNSAVSGGNIISDGGSPITARGIVWNANPDLVPTTIELTTKTTDGRGLGLFTSILADLNASTTYSVRSYATNSLGTYYGPEIQFKTNAEPTEVTDIDGNVYPLSNTICFIPQSLTLVDCYKKIISSKKNLDVSRYTDGTPIPQVTDPKEWINLRTGAWCYYENNSANGITYGKLYNWYAVMGIYDVASSVDPSLRKTLVPVGYHIPTYSEFETLSKISLMKEGGTSHWLTPNTGAGFPDRHYSILLPGGYRLQDGKFAGIQRYGFWWSSTSASITSESAWNFVLVNNSSKGTINLEQKWNALSVIFIKD